MKMRISISLFSWIAVLLLATPVHAEKVVGTCKVDVAGPHPFTIDGKLYEGKVPDKTIPSHASTRAWALKWAEEYRKIAPQMADMKVHMANDMISALTIFCWSEKGRLQMSAAQSETTKPQDFPDGPKKYRLVGDNNRDHKTGDLTAVLLSQEFTTGMIGPAEPGELNVTQSDSERLVATFSFKSKTSTVTGSVDFKRPKEVTESNK
jgi:hypothetical protein